MKCCIGTVLGSLFGRELDDYISLHFEISGGERGFAVMAHQTNLTWLDGLF